MSIDTVNPIVLFVVPLLEPLIYCPSWHFSTYPMGGLRPPIQELTGALPGGMGIFPENAKVNDRICVETMS